MIFLKIFVACVPTIYLPTLIVALLGHLCGVVVEKVNFGIGPAMATGRLWVLRLLPLTASVHFKDTSELDHPTEADFQGALDRQRLWLKLALAMCGPGALLLLSAMLLGPSAFELFISGFSQCFRGALNPLSDAQGYLSSFHYALISKPFAYIVGLMAAKFAAFNLLPIGATNGSAVIAYIARACFPSARWPARMHQWLVLPLLFFASSWLCAAIFYVWRFL